jgi:tetratricopeptide (TPR) repeat protein
MKRLAAVALLSQLLGLSLVAAQSLDDIPLPAPQLCFGLRTVVEPQALEICAALASEKNIRARDLAESWLRQAPDSAAAHYALAEVLLNVEGNAPRALFHLNRAESLSTITSIDAMLAAEPDDQSSPLWHYLTLNQLSSVHQLVGNQEESLRYLEALEMAYGVKLEPYKGWPLIKLRRFDEARQSAMRVLADEELDGFSAAQAWNTLCAVELSEPLLSPDATACDQALALDEASVAAGGELSTVTLSNAAEVALSRLQITQAEALIDRATRYPNPSSIANPWIQKLYLTVAQGRFTESARVLRQMLNWRDRQDPLVAISNRAEHFLAGATLLLLAGYGEDASKLANLALSQPDRNGNFSAADSQKEAIAALITTLATRVEYERLREEAYAVEGSDRLSLLVRAQSVRFDAWRAGRRAASLFANAQLMQDRLRPYGPLDVHIPEWMEMEIVGLLGSGVAAAVIEQAETAGIFNRGAGYRFAYLTEVAALESQHAQTAELATQALRELPAAEKLLSARILWHRASALWQLNSYAEARRDYSASMRLDPSLARRLSAALPVKLLSDSSAGAEGLVKKLSASPRFLAHEQGLPLELTANSLCLTGSEGSTLSCYTARASETAPAVELPAQLFSVGVELSKAERSALTGASVVLRSQRYGEGQGLPDF